MLKWISLKAGSRSKLVASHLLALVISTELTKLEKYLVMAHSASLRCDIGENVFFFFFYSNSGTT